MATCLPGPVWNCSILRVKYCAVLANFQVPLWFPSCAFHPDPFFSVSASLLRCVFPVEVAMRRHALLCPSYRWWKWLSRKKTQSRFSAINSSYCVVKVAEQRKRQIVVSANLLCDSIVSALTPMTSAPRPWIVHSCLEMRRLHVCNQVFHLLGRSRGSRFSCRYIGERYVFVFLWFEDEVWCLIPTLTSMKTHVESQLNSVFLCFPVRQRS